MMEYKLHRTDGPARRGTQTLAHGTVETPAFMPVGTYGAVKTMSPLDLQEVNAHIVLGNTFHLWLRPGLEVIEAHGGLHRFMGWDGPILTDSGGFQLFSLAQNTKVTEQAAVFRSHIDGRLFELSPERAIAILDALGSDVAMVLDHVIALPAGDEAIRDACERTIRWAKRCQAAATRSDQAQFAIV